MTREKLVAELTRDERLTLFVYDDATGRQITRGSVLQGHPTIGIGRSLDTNGITQAEAQYLLANDITAVELRLTREYPWFSSLDDVRQRALVNMAFNLGVARLRNFTAMLACIEHRDWDAAARAMLNSLWADQVGPRAQRIAEMIRTGADA